MPADKKKSNSGGGSQKKEKSAPKDAKQPDAPASPNPKLHATAKAFVPAALKANATAWTPTGKDSKKPVAAASSESSASGSAKAPPAKDGANSGKEAAAKPAPKASAPSAPAWGSKPSAAIKKATPARPQQKSASQNQNQHQHQRGGDRDSGKRNDRSGNRNDKGGGGGNSGGGTWGRAATKPGSGGRDNPRDGGGHRDQGRQSQNRGGNRSGGGDQGRDDNSSWSRGKAVPVDLMEPGDGKTDAEKAVTRVNVDTLLAMRADHMAAPAAWEEEEGAEKPPPACIWDTPTRITEIEEATKAARIGGDVSQKDKNKRKGGKPNPNDTAPALEDCKPLEVNEGTRWKPKVMDAKDGEEVEVVDVDSKEDVLRKAMLILNKLSLTKFDKLSDEFINCGIGRDVECLTGAVSLIVTYAQEQQHFSAMYAGLCLKLANTPMEGIDEGSKKGKKFKKILLGRCQSEFETDTLTKINEATKDDSDPAEVEYHSNLVKKHYLGHMRFIGELYKGDLISIKIMLFCLPALLKGETDETSNEVDEEKVECFSKLMTVIGSSLEAQSEAMRAIGKADAAESLGECWRIVEVMAGRRKEAGPEVSNRIKYMLQDLLEMKAKGWIKRREEETAKTLAQIHKEVAKEERAAARKSSSSANLRGQSKGSMRRGASSGDVRVMDNKKPKPQQVDSDGFVSVAPSKGGFNRSGSMPVMSRSTSKEGFQKYSTRGSVSSKPESVGRKSSSGKFAVLNESGSRRSSKKGSSDKAVEKAAAPVEEEKPKVNYLSPDQCGDKAKNILKEYFVGGDTADAVLSIHELVGAGDEGSLERGTKVVEQAILMVLEMKQEHIEKFVGLYLQCAKEKKIESDSFVLGLNDPLEFLNDVAIDAPLAIPHLAGIVAELVKADVISFNFLLNSPEYFRTDQNAADFGAKVMKKIGGDAIGSEDYIEVIEKLMTCEDKEKHSAASDLIAAV